jgi:Xaa-Pro aminopeptidase
MKSKIYSQRLKKLRAKTRGACLVENPVDLFYLTGLQLSCGTLVVAEKESCLFVDGRYLQKAQEEAPMPAALIGDKELTAYLKKYKTLAFDSKWTSYERCLKWQKLARRGSLVPVAELLKEGRALKDEGELDKLRRSAQLLWKGFKHLQGILKEGMTEKEAALEFELFCRKNGAQGLAFEPIIAFGANGAMPHHHSTGARLKKGEAVLVDIGVIVDHYRSDMTRVLFFKGADPQIEKMYAIAKQAQAAALALCKPGTKVKELDLAARAVLKKEKMEELFVHSLGHGIGLETHEFPRLSAKGQDKDVPLKAGMVITIEPGLYLPGIGGVRYEDTVIITKTGYENLYL